MKLEEWKDKRITKPIRISFLGKSIPRIKDKANCRHKWKIGAFIGAIIKGKIKKIGIYIKCDKCKKHIKAYY